MSKYHFIISKLLKLNYKSLKSLVNLSIFLSIFICVFLIPVCLSVIDGFEHNIKSKIVSFDGYARVYLDEINYEQYQYIEQNTYALKFHENEGIIKTNKASEAVTIHAYIDDYNPLYHLRDFLLFNTVNINKKDSNGIFIGKALHDRLFSSSILDTLQKQVILINSDNIIRNVDVLGVFQTYVPLYDEHFVLSNINEYHASGFIIDKSSYNKLEKNISSSFYTYDQRYYEFLKWLNSYDLPIFILLLSIVCIALINNIFCFNIDIVNRKRDSYIFDILGLSFKQINFIYTYKYFLLTLFAIFSGTIVALVLIYMQLNYNLIKLPIQVYFSNSISLSVKFVHFLYAPFIFLIQSFYILIKKRKILNAI
ncbi:MAG: hypothetical protein CMG66_01155 [Candidatus Marinimicrobia bacterium]|nr:hypothetical protein [Candidatus Neomarinimicrobiota bacterium]|tara:strand:- start:24510 stop:25610 length:1101 start_codon:yes stop_codon:yes gene_type:complete